MDKIESSPKYGWDMNKTCKILLIFAVSIATLMLIGTIVGISIDAIGDGVTESVIGIYATLLIVAIFADIIWSYFLIRQYVFEYKIKLWEKDFVKLYAKVETGYGDDKIVEGLNFVVVYKFRYDKQEHIIKGGTLCDRFGVTKASKLIGQRVPIFYSPTYDEVVFIKEIAE